eukprot:m.31747 g.31747  ORF g.31747 m.31747 type:complete len:461 (-) comp9832_c0_seq1:205-1587(-)
MRRASTLVAAAAQSQCLFQPRACTGTHRTFHRLLPQPQPATAVTGLLQQPQTLITGGQGRDKTRRRDGKHGGRALRSAVNSNINCPNYVGATAKQKRLSAILGCLYGACIGDAAGAFLEMRPGKPSPRQVEMALHLPGGGVHGLAPAQLTDDGEMTLCCAQALAEGGTAFNDEIIAKWYHKWVQSEPFDMGETTRKSIGAPLARLMIDPFHHRDLFLSDIMSASARAKCGQSLANGALMRASPIGLWGHRLPASVVARQAARDARLSHPHPQCLLANAAYCVALGHLVILKAQGVPGSSDNSDSQGAASATAGHVAVLAARSWLSSDRVFHDIGVYGVLRDETDTAVVQGWVDQALAAGTAEQATVTSPPVATALTMAFWHLKNETPFGDMLPKVLAHGGDTDTNAAITGALVGANSGFDNLPKDTVFKLDLVDAAVRPEFLLARNIPEIATKLLAACPA